MKIITKYQCEICLKIHETKDSALRCESKGFFNPDFYPAGLMFEYHHNGFVGIFAIPKKVGFYNGGQKDHVGYSGYWACRAEGYNGDSLGDEMCGGDYLSSENESFERWKSFHCIKRERENIPEFTRMALFIKSEKIKPCYYNELGELIKL